MVEAILRDRKPAILEQGAEVTVEPRRDERPHVGARPAAGLDQPDRQRPQVQPGRHAAARFRSRSQERADALRITVTDNGIGFDMKYHDRMFGLFNRLVRQEEFEGTGAGLAIVKKVVEKMGGRIWAESTPGAGATFFVELPRRASLLARESDMNTRGTADSAGRRQSDGPGPHVAGVRGAQRRQPDRGLQGR